MVVQLSHDEILQGAQFGMMRHASMLGKSWCHGKKKGKGWDEDIEGALAEVAFAKGMGAYWSPGLVPGAIPDVGKCQVKSSDLPDARLIIRPRDRNASCVLVLRQTPVFIIVGWMYADTARELFPEENPNDDTLCVMVPQEELYAPDALPKEYLIV